MPISQFPTGLQKVLSLLPGTYGTSLIRNHSMQGVFDELIDQNFPEEVIESMKDVVDCNIDLFGKNVSIPVMYTILVSTIAVLIVVYVLLNKKK